MWMKMLKSCDLSRAEEKIIQSYESSPEGPGFMSMAQLLYGRGYKDEATEILMAGVAGHPKNTVARVLLTSYLWEKGLFVVAWKTLQEAARGSLEGNILAWTLTFKLALVLGYEKHARSALACLQASSEEQNEEVQHLIHTYTLSGLEKARNVLLAPYDPTTLDLPGGLEGASYREKAESYEVSESLREVEGASGYSEGAREARGDGFDEFHTVNLAEIFSPTDQGSSSFGASAVELDSLTLAEIFEKQNCYAKSLAIYRRLSSLSPGHDGLRKKILLLEKKLKDEENSPHEDVDDLIDSLQERRLIDEKRFFLQKMLENLGRA